MIMGREEENEQIEVSVVMPCLNEEEAIGSCIAKAKESFQKLGIRGEIVVADNGSTDRSVSIAKSLGARVVYQPIRGYGSAYHKGIGVARGRYIVMGDSDDTYDFSDLAPFLDPLRDGYDFVIGNRFGKDLDSKAMPLLHRYVGTPILSGILRWWFNVSARDAHCGMRAFRREAYDRLHLVTTGMEYASEMLVNAGRARLRIKEVPIAYHVRKGESKLHTFRDGWRHLRFMLLYSPRYLFIIPGLVVFAGGLALLLVMLVRPIHIGEIVLDLHPMFLASLATLLGYQIANLGFFAKLYSFVAELDQPDPIITWFSRRFKLERMLAIGVVVLAVGVMVGISAILSWVQSGFGALFEVKRSLAALTLIVLGVQTMFTAFFYSILSIGLRRNLENSHPVVEPQRSHPNGGTRPLIPPREPPRSYVTRDPRRYL